MAAGVVLAALQIPAVSKPGPEHLRNAASGEIALFGSAFGFSGVIDIAVSFWILAIWMVDPELVELQQSRRGQHECAIAAAQELVV